MNRSGIFFAFVAVLAVASANPIKEAIDSLLGVTTQAPHLNGTTLAPSQNGTNNATLLSNSLNGTVVESSLNSTLAPHLNASSSGLKNETESSLNATTVAPLLNETVTTTLKPKSRSRRDCKSADLSKYEPQIVSFLEEQLGLYLKNISEAPIVSNAQQAPDANATIAQDAHAAADSKIGEAIASVIGKRANTIQNVASKGAAAVSNAESSKNAENVVQTAEAKGSKTAISNAKINHSDVKNGVAVQKVAAAGDKAIAASTSNKEGGITSQSADALGHTLSVASTKVGKDEAVKGAAPVCAPALKMDDNLRNFLRTAVADAIKSLSE